MANKTSKLLSAIKEGTAQDVERILIDGYRPPAQMEKHPILELFYGADPKQPTPRELPEKLEAFLAHSVKPSWRLHPQGSNAESIKWLVSACLPKSQRGSVRNGFRDASLLSRAVGSGNIALVDVLLDHGATILKDKQATEMAVIFKHPDILLRLLSTIKPGETPSDIGQIVCNVAECAHATQRPDLLAAIEALMPEHFTADTRKAWFGDLLNNGASDRSIEYWAQQNPELFRKLHAVEFTVAGPKQKYARSLWPAALRLAVRQGPKTPLFQLALSLDDAWLHSPVQNIHLREWEIKPGKQGVWSGKPAPVAPLQFLIHGVMGKREFFIPGVRAARALIKKGSKLWIGKDTPENSPTEAMLWAASFNDIPGAPFFQKRPEWLAPHPITGKDAISFARRVKDVEFWLSAGLRLGHCDANGNQTMASILSRSCTHSAEVETYRFSPPSDWAKWAAEGWKSRNFPITGQAQGQQMAEWSTSSMESFQAYEKHATGIPSPDPEALLRASMRNFNAPLSASLIAKGVDPLKKSSLGWSGVDYLALRAGGSLNGHEDKALERILMSLDSLASKDPSFWARALGGKVDPWRNMQKSRTLDNYPFAKKDRPENIQGELFRRIHQTKLKDASLWAWEDATFVLSGFLMTSSHNKIELLAPLLPKEILTDILLSMFNPDRWPGYDADQDEYRDRDETTYLQFGKHTAKILIAHGAELDGQDLRGGRMVDYWAKAKEKEQLETEYISTLREHSVLYLPEAITLFEREALHLATPSTTKPPSPKTRL